ncbi:MAG: hypothetical protein FKY71_13515 [Spiribacter salinus]|uniref:Uncharacterized protein n=1 Tax=Spiribacter salinus TaxID=1335746 RepID=A0A540VP14_9GAMM|nr:MAG: hypothetical protein FKY71_13515 [Spiribacter salinus]
MDREDHSHHPLDQARQSDSVKQGDNSEAALGWQTALGSLAALGPAASKVLGVAGPSVSEDGLPGFYVAGHPLSPLKITKYQDPNSETEIEGVNFRVPRVGYEIGGAQTTFHQNWTAEGETDGGWLLERRAGEIESHVLGEVSEYYEFSKFRATDGEGGSIDFVGRPDLAGGVEAATDDTELAARLDRVGVVDAGTVADHLGELLEGSEGTVEAEVVSGVRPDGSEFVEVLAVQDSAVRDQGPWVNDVHRLIYEDGTVTHSEQSRVLPKDYDGALRDQVESTRIVREYSFDTSDAGDEAGRETDVPGSDASDADNSSASIPTLGQTLAGLSAQGEILTLDEQLDLLDASAADDTGAAIDLPSQEDNLAVYGFPMDEEQDAAGDLDIVTLEQALPDAGVDGDVQTGAGAGLTTPADFGLDVGAESAPAIVGFEDYLAGETPGFLDHPDLSADAGSHDEPIFGAPAWAQPESTGVGRNAVGQRSVAKRRASAIKGGRQPPRSLRPATTTAVFHTSEPLAGMPAAGAHGAAVTRICRSRPTTPVHIVDLSFATRGWHISARGVPANDAAPRHAA